MVEGATTITVERKSPVDVKVRQIYVSLDGVRIAELLFGQSFTTTVDAGRTRGKENVRGP